ncbi:reverse transcriptase domain-containing protein [Tanacetum coccineum]
MALTDLLSQGDCCDRLRLFFLLPMVMRLQLIAIYVDDIVLTASSTSLLQCIISSLHREFEMTDLGALNYFLGISVTRDFTDLSVIWERVHDFQLGIESYQQKVNLTAPTMTFPGIEDHEMFSIIYEPVHGIIYKNSKKEKRVMRHSEIHKFCDATLNRVLEGLKSYNNDVKYGYVQKDLTKDETEYLKLFEEEIEERLKHRRQMRRWEMYVNGRPLGSRRERPE